MDDRNKWGDRAVYFLLGGMIGATVALLFAPRSGEETRELIANRVKDGKDALQEKFKSTCESISRTTEKFGASARDALDRGKEVVANEKEVLSAAIEAGKQAYREEKQAQADRRQG